MARLQSGDVLLTTRMGDVFHRFRQSILARDASFSQLNTESEMVKTSHARSLREREPAIGIESASQLDLHETLPFTRPHGQAGERFVVDFESNAHINTLMPLRLACNVKGAQNLVTWPGAKQTRDWSIAATKSRQCHPYIKIAAHPP
jgi:hypothetical protein